MRLMTATDAMTLRPIVSAPGDGETVRAPTGGPITFKSRDAQTGGSLTAFESTAPPGAGPPLHVHAQQDEVLYVVEGRLCVQLGSALHQAACGTFVFIPRGVPHAWQNQTAEPARFLVLFTPAAAGMERFFERAAELPADTPTADAFNRIGAGADMEVVGPPLGRSSGEFSWAARERLTPNVCAWSTSSVRTKPTRNAREQRQRAAA